MPVHSRQSPDPHLHPAARPDGAVHDLVPASETVAGIARHYGLPAQTILRWRDAGGDDLRAPGVPPLESRLTGPS